MPDFVLPSGVTTPFGENEPFRSTHGIRRESYSFAKNSFPVFVIDGENTKILQPGAALCRITSGADTGKVGIFQTGATDGRQTIANFVGINQTFVPWQLLDRDVDVAAVYSGVLIATKCMSLAADGTYEALSGANITAIAGLQYGKTLVFVD